MASYTVQKGDNLTHIARRFGIKSWRVLYNHPQNADFKRKRPNPDLIYPGDVLYIPSENGGPQVIDMPEMNIVGKLEDKPVAELTDEEKEAAFKAAIDELPPDMKGTALEVLKYVGAGVTVGQVLATFEIITLGPYAMLSPVVIAARLVLGWMAAWEVNEKMYGYRACAYTVTAWAFGEPRPRSSPEMLRRFKQFSPYRVVRDREKAWYEASIKTWQGLEAEYKNRNIEKNVLQLVYIMVGHKHKRHSGNIKQKLCHAMLMEFEAAFRGINKASWKEGYKVLYPR